MKHQKKQHGHKRALIAGSFFLTMGILLLPFCDNNKEHFVLFQNREGVAEKTSLPSSCFQKGRKNICLFNLSKETEKEIKKFLLSQGWKDKKENRALKGKRDLQNKSVDVLEKNSTLPSLTLVGEKFSIVFLGKDRLRNFKEFLDQEYF